MSAATARIGIKSIKSLLRKVCQLIAKFRDKYPQYMTPTQISAFDEMVVNCNALVDIIDILIET